MAIPVLLKKRIELRLANYCEARIPPRVRGQIRLGFRFRGHSVTLFEERPLLRDMDHWIESVVAQFRYDPETIQWRLYCADRNSRWHVYWDLDPSLDFDRLLKEVDDDPTGIFWG
jgi:hypothetical protein